MAAEGVELVAGLEDLAVMGFVEVLSRVPFFWELERRLRRILVEERVDLVIPVDYPGFNLRMTERARAAGVPVLYYVAPQVWAWKEGRAARLAQRADRVAVILPFEKEIFEREGGRAVFVGHPLLDRDDTVPERAAFCRDAELDAESEILALFPGSRDQEIRMHLAPFLEAGAELQRRRPGLQLAVARASSVHFQLPSGVDVKVLTDSRGLLRHARAAIVKSGTTTLEAALEGTPFVVAYRTHPWTYWLARRLVRVEHVALANLVAGSRVVPELLQGEVTPDRLARAVEPMLDDTPERRRIVEELAVVRERLGGPGAAARVAALAVEILEGEASDDGPGRTPGTATDRRT